MQISARMQGFTWLRLCEREVGIRLEWAAYGFTREHAHTKIKSEIKHLYHSQKPFGGRDSWVTHMIHLFSQNLPIKEKPGLYHLFSFSSLFNTVYELSYRHGRVT